jgi:RNA polymerase sigma factor (sigma-70 family)
MARVAAEERAALRELYDAVGARLFGVILRILSDRAEAEDVLQDVFLTVWRRASAFDPKRASAAAWLTAVARNRAIDRLRARGPMTGAADADALEIADDAAGAEAELIRSDEGRRLHACLGRLGEDQRSLIVTAFLGGLTYEALARRTGKPLGTVKSGVRRGLIRLRECLQS